MCWLSCCFGWLSFRSLLYFLTLSVSLSLSPSLVERKMVDENSCGLLCLISVVIIRRKRMTSMRSFTLLSKNTKIFEIVWVHQLPFHLLFFVCVCYFSLLSARCHCNRLNEIVSIACTPEFVHTNLKKKSTFKCTAIAAIYRYYMPFMKHMPCIYYPNIYRNALQNGQ